MPILSRCLILPFAWLLLSLNARAAESTAIAHYRVSYVGDQQFQIEADFALPTSRLDLNSQEASGRPDAQAASVLGLTAFDAEQHPVPVNFVGQGTWEFKAGAARRIVYRIRADHDAAKWIAGKDEVATRFDHSYFFAGDAFFLLDYDWPNQPVEVEFELPSHWLVTAPWPQDGRVYRASNADNLGSNVFTVGQDRPSQAQAGALQLTWLSDTRVKVIEPHLLPLFDKLPKVYGEFWGGTPGERLTVFFLSDPDTDGGAFRNSFAMRLATPLRDAERIVWEHTLGHELMHVWMNNSNDGIHTVGDGSAYWFIEGFTDYLTVKLSRQAGLNDEALTSQRLANQIRRYGIGRRLSPGVGLMAAGKEKHKNWELIYGGGALMALLLDAELSRESPTAFRDALRRVQHLGSTPIDGKRLLAVLDEASAGRASALMRQLDAGLSLADIRARLADSGVSVEGFASDEVYVSFAPCVETHCPSELWPSSK